MEELAIDVRPLYSTKPAGFRPECDSQPDKAAEEVEIVIQK